MPQIIYDQFHLGENQDNPLVASTNTLTHMLGCSPHEQLGLVGSGPAAFKSTSLTVVPDVIVPYSEAKVFMFFSGNIYKYNITLDVLTLIGSTSGAVTDAIYFDGYVYFSRSAANALGRMDIATETITPAFAVFSITTPTPKFHPMFVLAGDLYIGNEYYVALVDSTHTFVGNALDIPKDYRVTALTNISTDLLIGTENILEFPSTKLFRWNTWSETFSAESTVDIQTISHFLQDNGDLYFVGMNPNTKIFAYSEPYPVEMTMVPATNDSPLQRNNFPMFTPNHTARWRGRVWFSLYGSGSAYYPALYSFHANKKGLPNIVSAEILPPDFNIVSTVTTVASVGSYLLFGYTSPSSSGVGIVHASNGGPVHTQSTLITPYITLERQSQKDFTITVPYRGLYTSQTMTIESDVNYSGSFSGSPVRHDADRCIFYTDVRAASANAIRFNVTITNATTVPLFVEKIIIDFP